ncbi:hypothetical protein D3C75_882240 [compost metagenome]
MLPTVSASPIFAEQRGVGPIVQTDRHIQPLFQPLLDAYLRPARCGKAGRVQNRSFLAVQGTHSPNAKPDHPADVNGGLLQHVQHPGMNGIHQAFRRGVLIHNPRIFIQQSQMEICKYQP